MLLYKSYIWEKSGFSGIDQSALAQSNGRIFKSKQNDVIAWFLRVDTNSWKLEVHWKIVVVLGQTGCSHSGHGTLKLTVSPEWIDGIN